ncbi:MAG: hypothetical protein ACFE9Q_11545 [Candidatus Hodarchaeota archaeon]
MSEDNDENDMSLDEERKKLKELGVASTWGILTTGEKKKKTSEDEDKPVFRGFK